MSRKLLVPIDFSDYAREALAEAARFSKQGGDEITLLYAHQVSEVAIMDFTYVEPAKNVAEACESAERGLNMWAKEAGVGDTCKIEVVTGDPAREIARLSSDHDLVIMGTHGRSGLQHFLLGSVTEKVVRSSKCSVLVVKRREN